MLWPAWVWPAPPPPPSLGPVPPPPPSLGPPPPRSVGPVPPLHPQPSSLCRRSFLVPGAWRPGFSRLLPAERRPYVTWARVWGWGGLEDCRSVAWGRAARRPSHRSERASWSLGLVSCGNYSSEPSWNEGVYLLNVAGSERSTELI